MLLLAVLSLPSKIYYQGVTLTQSSVDYTDNFFFFVQSLFLPNSFLVNIFFTVFTIISLVMFASFTVLL